MKHHFPPQGVTLILQTAHGYCFLPKESLLAHPTRISWQIPQDADRQWFTNNIVEDIKHIEFIEDIKPIENIEDIKPIEDFINPKTDLDIFYDDKPLEIIKNDSLICCSVCKNNVKSYNTWNTLKKCFMCKECNKQGMPSGAII